MKKLIKSFLLTPLVFVLLSSSVWAQLKLNNGVTEHIEGFPIMEGLAESMTKIVMFDKPEGRIIESEVAGPGTAGAAKEFYNESLSQIGWNLQPNGDENILKFVKEGELLSLEFSASKNFVVINISLAPYVAP